MALTEMKLRGYWVKIKKKSKKNQKIKKKSYLRLEKVS